MFDPISYREATKGLIRPERLPFLRGTNLWDGTYTNLVSEGVTHTMTAPITGVYTILVPIQTGETYTVMTKGSHNRFIVFLANDLEAGSPVYSIVRKGTESGVSGNQEVTFTNEQGHKWLLATLHYSTVAAPNIECWVTNSDLEIDGRALALKEDINDVYVSRMTNSNLPLPSALHTEVYTQYENLVADYSEYAKVNTLGVDHAGNDIKEYVFKTPDYNDYDDAPRRKDPVRSKRKILVTTGIHGDEKSAVLAALQFFQDLCATGSQKLSRLYSGIEFRVIPICSPTAYDGNSRLNGNGVDINRNFTTNWVQTSPGNFYSGESPASELETQIIESWLETHSDAVCHVDCHNSGYVDLEVSYLAASKGTPYENQLKDAYLNTIDKLTKIFHRRYEIPVHRNLGYTGDFDGVATCQAQANSLGIPSATLEVSWQIPGDARYGSKSIAVYADILGNFFLEFTEPRVQQ